METGTQSRLSYNVEEASADTGVAVRTLVEIATRKNQLLIGKAGAK